MPETTVHLYDDDGLLEGTEVIEAPDDPADVVLAAVQTARAEVASLSSTGATRQTFEALFTAVEALVQ